MHACVGGVQGPSLERAYLVCWLEMTCVNVYVYIHPPSTFPQRNNKIPQHNKGVRGRVHAAGRARPRPRAAQGAHVGLPWAEPAVGPGHVRGPDGGQYGGACVCFCVVSMYAVAAHAACALCFLRPASRVTDHMHGSHTATHTYLKTQNVHPHRLRPCPPTSCRASSEAPSSRGCACWRPR